MKPSQPPVEPDDPLIAVVVPAYRVTEQILTVLSQMPEVVGRIYVIDDACPDRSGEFVLQHCSDSRVTVIKLPNNLGVGGAVMAGYRAAIDAGAIVIIKIDGDGQMDPSLIPQFVEPILNCEADYTKGNRFFDLTNIKNMPTIRLIGNALLSFLTKFSSGYWTIFDPTNGYTAIHAGVCARLPLDKISQRYFFESDLLFRLNIARAVVVDVPMDAKYANEISNLKISKITTEFAYKHFRNFIKRIFYNYFLRDLSLASLQLVFGACLMLFGISFGGYHWWLSAQTNETTAAGTVMLAAMPTLVGIQLLLSFIGYDIACMPTQPLQKTNRVFKSSKLKTTSRYKNHT
jgi:dolichol-phosphate mannosyltransferase